jgi:hypothetical protein
VNELIDFRYVQRDANVPNSPAALLTVETHSFGCAGGHFGHLSFHDALA